MKKIFSVFVFVLLLTITSCIIGNLKPYECAVVETTIIKITKGSSYDIVFHSIYGDYFYINRGLKNGLNLEDLKASVLNKTVTLHLARMLSGTITSEHIAQIAIGDNIIYTEFD